MSKKILILIVVVIVVISGVIFISQMNPGDGADSENSSVDTALVDEDGSLDIDGSLPVEEVLPLSSDEVKIRQLTPEENEIMQNLGLDVLPTLSNEFDNRIYTQVFSEDGQTLLQTDNIVLPFKSVLSGAVIGDGVVVISTGIRSTVNGNRIIQNDPAVYIYNINNNQSYTVFTPEDDVQDLFVFYKDQRFIISTGSQVDLYSTSGVFMRTIFEAGGKDNILLADQDGVSVGKLRVFTAADGEALLDIK